ncbi:MAG: hypothetical protein K8R54_06730 [Bacteroidales bacterium]|nr:hypothetical protein [Bacteroidales bacterium]
MNENQILEHAGKISRKLANEIVNKEYNKYLKHRQLTEGKHALEQLKTEIKHLKNKVKEIIEDKK